MSIPCTVALRCLSESLTDPARYVSKTKSMREAFLHTPDIVSKTNFYKIAKGCNGLL